MSDRAVEVLKFEIAKLQLSGGDILVLRPPYMHDIFSESDMKAMKALMPPGVTLWLIPQDVEMVVISPPKEVG